MAFELPFSAEISRFLFLHTTLTLARLDVPQSSFFLQSVITWYSGPQKEKKKRNHPIPRWVHPPPPTPARLGSARLISRDVDLEFVACPAKPADPRRARSRPRPTRSGSGIQRGWVVRGGCLTTEARVGARHPLVLHV